MPTPEKSESRSAGSCRPCAACCTFLPIPAGEVGPGAKPAGLRCPQLGVDGCGAYARRPELCRKFQCAWLADASWPLLWRPDQSGLMCLREKIDLNLPAAALYEVRPGALQEPLARQVIEELERTTAVIAVIDNQQRRRRLLGRWSVEPAEHPVPAPYFLSHAHAPAAADSAELQP